METKGGPNPYKPWRNHSPLQRKFLHIAIITSAIVILGITFHGIGELILAPFDLVHRWFIRPTPISVIEPGNTESIYFDQDSPYAVVGGAAIICTVLSAIVSLIYGVGYVTMRRLGRAHSNRKL